MKLFKAADSYCKRSNWKKLALLKTCLFSMGVIVGTQVPKKHRKLAIGIGGVAFLATYVPLMYDFVSGLVTKDEFEV